MSRSKLSLIDRAEHGDADAILKLLAPKQGLSWKRRKYWTWQLISTLDVPISEKIPESVLLGVLWDAANLKRKGFLDKDDEKQFPKWVEAYKKLHLGRAYWVLYVNTSDNKLEREYLTAGCKAKSRHCSAVLASMLSRNGDFLKATDLCFEACSWPVDKLLDCNEDSDDAILKQKGCRCIMEHLTHNEVEIDKSKPLLIKVYENGDAEQKKKSAEELEKRVLDYLKQKVVSVQKLAEDCDIDEAIEAYSKFLTEKDELLQNLPKHDKTDIEIPQIVAELETSLEENILNNLRFSVFEIEKLYKRVEHAVYKISVSEYMRILDTGKSWAARIHKRDRLDALLKDIKDNKINEVLSLYQKHLIAKAESLEKDGDYAEAAKAYETILGQRKMLFKEFPSYIKVDDFFAYVEGKKNECAEKIKSRKTYILLAVLLGYFGAHDFYAGSPLKGKCKLKLSLLSLGFFLPLAWCMSLLQAITASKNLAGSEKDRANAKHSEVGPFCILYVAYVIVSVLYFYPWKQSSPMKNSESVPTSMPENSVQLEATTPLTLGGMPNVSTSTSGMIKLPTAEDIVLPFETPEPSALTGTPVSAKSLTEQLQEAVKEGDAQKVKSLMEQGADANTYKDDKGKTLLHLAVDAESLGTVQALLKGKADPNARNNEGRTPIYSAIYRQNEAIVKALLVGGAKTKVQDKWSITPMEFAKELSCKSSILTLLKNSRK